MLGIQRIVLLLPLVREAASKLYVAGSLERPPRKQSLIEAV